MASTARRSHSEASGLCGRYTAPVLYPFTVRGFDGVAWIEPWFMAVNYAVLAVAGVWVMSMRAGTANRRA